MLVEFTVGNFRSFKDPETFSMVAAKLKAQDKALDANNVFEAEADLILLKSSAIYGANASGKSNLAAALRFMRSLILNSSKDTQANEKIEVEPFRLSTTTTDQPSFFEVVFIVEKRRYRYGFKVNTEGVIEEWLYYVPTTKEAKLFVRQQAEISLAPAFKEGKQIVAKTRNNALFLSVVAQFNGPLALKLLEGFRGMNIISGLEDAGLMQYTMEALQDEVRREAVVQFIKKLEMGIEDIRVDRALLSPTRPATTPRWRGVYEKRAPYLYGEGVLEILTAHKKYNAEGELVANEVFRLGEHESEGTKKIIALAAPLIEALQNGQTLFVDEMDARLHPLLTRAIISLFNAQDTNPQNAQLIFITHDTNLLSKDWFRRDQIWFAEKDKLGATHLYSLAEFKVRNDASFGADYISGRYGAIPFVGDLSQLLGEPNAKKKK